jgi:hypothetical protein
MVAVVAAVEAVIARCQWALAVAAEVAVEAATAVEVDCGTSVE